jgi:iron complex outermembrane recepter protein
MADINTTNHNERVSKIRVWALSGACAAALAASVSTVAAQDRIIVTGSRIATTNQNSPQPIQTISEEDFIDSGALTVSEALNQLPQLGDALEGGSSINSLNGGFGVGTQTVNLRNLGANRTLVLVNGRRHVGGDIGTSAVDLNSIPAGLIERIDVVTGANSAVYGADAVTGVVNIVLKSNYEGTDISVRGGLSGEGDGEEYAVSFTHGGTFKRGDYLIGGEYSKQGDILGADRSFAQFDGSAATGLSEAGNGSGVNPGGLFLSSLGGTGGFDSTGAFVQPFAERFQRVPFRSLQNETERYVISGRAGYDFTDTVSGFAEATYARTNVKVQFEPQLAVFSDGGFGSSGTAGFRFPTAPTVPVASVGADLRVITRRFAEFGPRMSKVNRDLYRIATGLDVDLGFAEGHISYQYGRVEATQTDYNTIDKLRLMTAIDPAACAAASGCGFVNLYGRGTIDPGSLGYVSDDLSSKSKSEQNVVSAYVTGDLFEFAGNQISYVVGGEWRDESATITPNAGLIAVIDPVTGSGNLVGLKGTRAFFGNTAGSYDVIEGFGELKIPLGDTIDVGFSARVSDYSTVGTEFTWGVNADWRIFDSLSARGSIGSATRAPNINELFAPERASTTAVADPCDTLDDMGGALAQAAGCGAFVSATFNPTDLDQQIRGVSGGNPNLGSETADTYTVGLIGTPTDRTAISIDYFLIDMSNVLAPAFSAQATLDRCITTGDAFFCNNITRDAMTGFVTSIRSEQVNLAQESIEGLELAVTHSFSLGGGDVTFNSVFTHLLDRERQVNDTSPIEDLVGRIDNIKNKANISVRYTENKWGMGATLRYLGSAVQSVSADPAIAVGNNIGAIAYLDLYANYQITEKFGLRAGVENVTDKSSPVVTQLFENNGSADTTSAGIYDVRGLFGFVGLDYSF